MAHHDALMAHAATARTRAAVPIDPLAGFDPRVRVVAAFACCVAAVTLGSYAALATALLLALLALAFARPCPRTLGRRLLALEGFMVMILVMLPFSVPAAGPGDVLAQVGPLTASHSGLHQAVVILLKTNIVVLILAALIGRLEPHRFGRALAALRLPTKLVTLLLLTVRYLDVLHREYGRLRRSMKVRGFRARANPHGLRSIGYLVGMLLVRSVDRSERILAAMRCRGFDGRFHHGALARLGWQDGALAAAAMMAILTCLAVEVAVR